MVKEGFKVTLIGFIFFREYSQSLQFLLFELFRHLLSILKNLAVVTEGLK